jgi:hypothetical protein
MTEPSRLRKRPLEADAATIARAADEIDIAGCATIAYSSEDPAHPVERIEIIATLLAQCLRRIRRSWISSWRTPTPAKWPTFSRTALSTAKALLGICRC